jgi:hypothetical protein
MTLEDRTYNASVIPGPDIGQKSGLDLRAIQTVKPKLLYIETGTGFIGKTIHRLLLYVAKQAMHRTDQQAGII